MANGPTVRTAGPADAHAICYLLLAFNDAALSPQTLAERLVEAEDLETVFLAELDSSLAGLLVLRTSPTISGPNDWAEITELYVQPTARRKGVGTALAKVAIASARERGCVNIHLLVNPANEPAIAFYETLGFHRGSWEMRRSISP
jgi:ribosomal protein S18 acetylase RimI-like enzyme